MKLRAHLYLAASVVWALVPFIAEAALVPCGNSSNVGTGQGQSLSCDLCYMGQMVQNLINFALGLSMPLAAGLFAWAGLLYMSARGNPGQIDKAHKIFRSVVIGFVLALAAWTIVQTIVTTLFNKNIFINPAGWSTLNCDAQRHARQFTVNKTLDQVLGSNLAPVQSGGSAYQCTNGTLVNGFCRNAAGDVVGVPYVASTPGGALSCPDGTAVAGSGCYSVEGQYSGPALAEDQRDRWTYECYDLGIEASCNGLQGNGSVGGIGGLSQEDRDRLSYECADFGIQESCAKLQGGSGTPTGVSCPMGYRFAENATDYWCQSTTDPKSWVEAEGPDEIDSNYGRAGRLCDDTNPACNPAALKALGLSDAQANAMSCIAVTESGGVPATPDSSTQACGLWQFTSQTSKSNWQNPALHGPGCSTDKSDCYRAECQQDTMSRMLNQQSYQPWTGSCTSVNGCGGTAYGQPWNPGARKCVETYDPSAVKW